jgi:hypothetical protein
VVPDNILKAAQQSWTMSRSGSESKPQEAPEGPDEGKLAGVFCPSPGTQSAAELSMPFARIELGHQSEQWKGPDTAQEQIELAVDSWEEVEERQQKNASPTRRRYELVRLYITDHSTREVSHLSTRSPIILPSFYPTILPSILRGVYAVSLETIDPNGFKALAQLGQDRIPQIQHAKRFK